MDSIDENIYIKYDNLNTTNNTNNTNNTKNQNINNQLDIIINKLLVLETKINNIEQKLSSDISQISQKCDKMERHIDFVDNVYVNVKKPLEYICNKANSIMSLGFYSYNSNNNNNNNNNSNISNQIELPYIQSDADNLNL